MAEHSDRSGTARKTGLFDIRVMIAALIGAYGVVLAIMSLFTSDEQLAKADGLNINIWAGLGMMVVAGGFFAWARWRPIAVPEDVESPEDEAGT